ncbi:MAG: hypothetical protein ACOC0O_07285 [Spirochaetota bacterium]
MGDQRRFSDEQAKAIINRALELQGSHAERQSDGAVAESDLEALADELGVPWENVQQAIAELDRGEPESRRSDLLGEATVERATRSLSATLGAEELERLAAALPSLLGETGQASVMGRTLTYATGELEAMRTGARTRVTVHAGSERTTVSIVDDMRTMAAGLFGGIVGGVGLGVGFGVGFGVGLGVLGSAAFAAIVPIAVIGLSFIGARGLYRAIVRSRRDRIEERLARIARSISS